MERCAWANCSYSGPTTSSWSSVPGRLSRGPEGITFVPAADSPIDGPLVLAGHEISGTLAVYQVETPGGSGGDGGEPNATYYQLDFVVGQHINHLRQPHYYTADELVRFAHGNTEDGITRRSDGEFVTDDRIANCIESHDITVGDGTATMTFTVADGCDPIQLSLVSYEKVGPGWSPGTEAKQTLADWNTAAFAPGTHTLTVDIPNSEG